MFRSLLSLVARRPAALELRCFFFWSWLLLALHLSTLAAWGWMADLPTALWTLATTASYALIYLLPSLMLGSGLAWLLSGKPARLWQGWVLAGVLIALTSTTHTLLFADHMVYGMYGFHINGFVLDLVTTPGGIESLGASRSTELTASLVVLGFFALQAAVYLVAMRPRSAAAGQSRQLRARTVLVLLVLLGLGERVAYGISHAANYRPILFASERYPLYLPLTFRKLAARVGVVQQLQDKGSVHVSQAELSYPLAPLQVEKPAKPLNVVWLVAESLRYDMLDPKIMPNLWQFSEESLRMERHYSGGNMTQMGVFSMFYGLYGNYWFPMLAARRSPVLMDVLQQQDYRFGLYTSQRFTYPAFDKTVFVNMKPAEMHELSGGASPWQRDRQNVDALSRFIDEGKPGQPFMAYMFFESTHANYDFPEETAIAKPYLEDLNYLTADFAKDIGLIKNRYINAANHVDQQIGRVISHLRERQLLDNTIIIVVGDHGEEFMERSRWGHSAEFNRFQTGTPAVIHVPGHAPRVISGISSHLDIPATLLPLLGVKNPSSDYSLGSNLLAPDFKRPYAVAADWNRIAYLGSDYKLTVPVNVTGALRNEATDGNDMPVVNQKLAKQAVQPAMAEIMVNLARFSRSPH